MNSYFDMVYVYGLVELLCVICIKIFNFKGSKKYDLYVIDFNFAGFTEMGLLSIFKSP